MAELPGLNLDDLSPEERANLSANLNRMRLNDSQAILQAPYSAGQPYTYEKPDSFGIPTIKTGDFSTWLFFNLM